MGLERNMEKIVINKRKSIGEVVFILEGKKDEFRLFRNIFNEIFSFTTVVCKSQKTDLSKYHLPDNRNSTIFLINANNSAIKFVDENEYIKNIFNKISGQFKIDISNSAVYYIWDRDQYSNSKIKVKELINKYYNSRDNGYEMPGLLLLSYPSIESFLISCYEDFNDSKIVDIKRYTKSKKYSFSKVDENKLIHAAQVFLNRYRIITNTNFTLEQLDINMKNNNNIIFEYEEKYNELNKYYYYFSCLVISLFDLGILDIIDYSNIIL